MTSGYCAAAIQLSNSGRVTHWICAARNGAEASSRQLGGDAAAGAGPSMIRISGIKRDGSRRHCWDWCSFRPGPFASPAVAATPQTHLPMGSGNITPGLPQGLSSTATDLVQQNASFPDSVDLRSVGPQWETRVRSAPAHRGPSDTTIATGSGTTRSAETSTFARCICIASLPGNADRARPFLRTSASCSSQDRP